MASEKYEDNDLVWAKMKGYPPWPARIAKPLSNAKPPKNRKAQFVYFFGSNNFAWILDENITPHSESILNNLSNKSAAYQRAIEELVTFSKSIQQDKQDATRNVDATISIKNENIDEDEKYIIPKRKIVPKNEKVSSKKEKDIPKKEKGREGSLRNGKKCQEKRVATSSKSSKKIARKRPLDIKVKEEPDDCTSPKNQKIILKDDPLVDSTPYFNSGIDNISVWDDDSVSRSASYVTDDQGHSAIVQRKHVSPTLKRIGLLGLSSIGSAAVQNLLRSGHDVTVWNRTPNKCASFVAMGARMAESPADVISSSDIIYNASDPDASKTIIFEDRGILNGLEQAKEKEEMGKGYIEMSSIDPETSKKINDAVVNYGGKYLEAPICGDNTTGPIIIAAGDKELFFNSIPFFHAIVEHAHFISSNVGIGSQMSILMRMFFGTMYAAVAEILNLATRLRFDKDDFLDLLNVGPLQFQNLTEKCRRMMSGDFQAVTPLKHIQKDLNFTLLLSNEVSQPMPVTAAANQVFRRAKSLNYSNLDVSAVYQALHN